MQLNEFYHEKIHGTELDAAKEIERIDNLILHTLWGLSFRDRGMGHGDYGVSVTIEGKNVLIVEAPCLSIAGHIVDLHNQSL